MSEHTKTPWSNDGYGGLVGPDGKTVTVWGLGIAHGQRSAETEANARHIVHCVNNHERLVEALALVVDQWTDGDGCFGSIEQARALLASLEAEKGGEL